MCVNRNIENITLIVKKVKRYKSYSEQRNYNEYIDVEETTQNRPLYGNVEVDIKVDSRLSGIASGQYYNLLLMKSSRIVR